MVMGPVFQEVVDAVDRAEESKVFRCFLFSVWSLQERVGTWIRCQNGWLPLAIGGCDVYMFVPANESFQSISCDPAEAGSQSSSFSRTSPKRRGGKLSRSRRGKVRDGSKADPCVGTFPPRPRTPKALHRPG